MALSDGISPSRILVIKLGALGDFIQALGPMAAIRRHHPGAHITLMTTRPFVTFAQRSGYFDEILCDARPRWPDLAGWLALRRTLRAGRFQRVYDLQNNDRTALYLRLFPKRERPEWFGAAPGASHRNASPERLRGPVIDGLRQTLALAGITDVPVDRMAWAEADLSRFDLRAPFALLVPGSSPGHPEKRWPHARYGALAAHLAALGVQPVVIGTQGDAAEAEGILRLCPQALDLTGQTALLDLPALARGAALTVGNDTGPIHVIGVTGCPTLVLFRHAGTSDPSRHAPPGDHVRVLARPEMDSISVDEVIRSLPDLPSLRAGIHR